MKTPKSRIWKIESYWRFECGKCRYRADVRPSAVFVPGRHEGGYTDPKPTRGYQLACLISKVHYRMGCYANLHLTVSPPKSRIYQRWPSATPDNWVGQCALCSAHIHSHTHKHAVALLDLHHFLVHSKIGVGVFDEFED